MFNNDSNAFKNDFSVSNNTIEINVDDLSNETKSINELCSYYKNKLSEKNILCKVDSPSKDVFTEGTFEENIWAIHRDLKKTYRYIKFDELNRFKQKNLSLEQLLLIKCWVAQKLLDTYYTFEEKDNASKEGRSSEHLSDYVNILTQFIIESNNFSPEFLDNTRGDNMKYFFSSRTENYTANNQKKYLNSVLEYLDFCLFKSKVTTEIFPKDIYITYHKKIKNLKDEVTESSKPSENGKGRLPRAKDIILFDYYVRKFFDDDKINEDFKMYFYPLLIWWKLTNIIPMRASELCVKIPRDCLLVEDNKYYLIINRAKKKEEDEIKNRDKKVELPLLTNLQITKEFYDFINGYIEKTNEFGDSKTLLSYKAHAFYRYKITKYNTMSFSKNISSDNISMRRFENDYFSTDQLRQLINNFYNKVIGEYFGDSLIEDKITANDTRHFAFTSLILQGVPLIETAILGGHSNTNTLDEYTYDNNVYIDSQVFIAINRSLRHYKASESTISDIVFKKPKICPVPIEECVATSFLNTEFGYCTSQKEGDCESYDCYNCSKWWCKPDNESLKMLMKIHQEELDKKNKELKSSVEFMLKIFKNATLLDCENPDSEVCMDVNLVSKLGRLSKKIKDDAEEIIKIKSQLLQGIVISEDDELTVIKKLQYLDNTFKKDTNYLK